MENPLSTKEFLALSIRTKKIANSILIKYQILEILSKFGIPLVIGSLELDMMFDKDIDIVVETKNLKINAKKALNEFIDLGIAQKYEFGDFTKFPRENRPKGYSSPHY